MEQFETVDFWHFEVKKNEVREWKFVAPGIFAVALEIGHGFLAIADNMEGIMDFSLGKGALDQKDVVLAILDEQDHQLLG